VLLEEGYHLLVCGSEVSRTKRDQRYDVDVPGIQMHGDKTIQLTVNSSNGQLACKVGIYTVPLHLPVNLMRLSGPPAPLLALTVEVKMAFGSGCVGGLVFGPRLSVDAGDVDIPLTQGLYHGGMRLVTIAGMIPFDLGSPSGQIHDVVGGKRDRETQCWGPWLFMLEARWCRGQGWQYPEARGRIARACAQQSLILIVYLTLVSAKYRYCIIID
jgi:hypothetical protein